MNNLNSLRSQVDLVDQYWSYLASDPILPTVILARRAGIQSVNISLASDQVAGLWSSVRPGQELPLVVFQLTTLSPRLLVDISALVDASSVRVYTEGWTVRDTARLIDLWPQAAKPYLVGLGVYSDRPDHYKVYSTEPDSDPILKETVIGGIVVTASRETSQPVTEQLISDFGLERLDSRSMKSIRRDQDGAEYLTIWNGIS